MESQIRTAAALHLSFSDFGFKHLLQFEADVEMNSEFPF